MAPHLVDVFPAVVRVYDAAGEQTGAYTDARFLFDGSNARVFIQNRQAKIEPVHVWAAVPEWPAENWAASATPKRTPHVLTFADGGRVEISQGSGCGCSKRRLQTISSARLLAAEGEL